jgi:hypothetical protein
MSDEQWRAVVGYEGLYEVSDQGRVRSLTRTCWDATGTKARTRKGQYLKPGASRGYLSVRLCRNGSIQTLTVHSLVAAAFIGPRPEGMQVCHWNGNGGDNRLANLRYDSPSSNQLDTVRYDGNRLARRDACSRGHLFTPENTRYYPSAPRTRKCKTCLRERATEFRRRRKEPACS